MEEKEPGKLIHENGKTVFTDPKTHQTVIFDEIIPEGLGLTNHQMALAAAIKALMPHSNLILGPIGYLSASNTSLDVDPLGPEEFYLLIPSNKTLGHIPITVGAWVTEYENGHKPNYEAHSKHRILESQAVFLKDHGECPIVAWIDLACPIFPSIACQTHAKAMKPVTGINKEVFSTADKNIFLETSSVKAEIDAIMGEERDV